MFVVDAVLKELCCWQLGTLCVPRELF